MASLGRLIGAVSRLGNKAKKLPVKTGQLVRRIGPASMKAAKWSSKHPWKAAGIGAGAGAYGTLMGSNIKGTRDIGKELKKSGSKHPYLKQFSPAPLHQYQSGQAAAKAGTKSAKFLAYQHSPYSGAFAAGYSELRNKNFKKKSAKKK